MPTSPAVTRRRGPAARSRKAVLTGAAGNLVANFDGSVLTYFIPTLAAVFYPTKTPSVGLMLVLASYGAGFLMKPLGAVLFGIMGDRWGRRPALYGSIAVMGLSSLVITVLPGYATIGAAAPMLLVPGPADRGTGHGRGIRAFRGLPRGIRATGAARVCQL
jgi:MFS family permease